MNRLLPHPLTALALLAMWLLLTRSLSPGSLLLGSLLALAGSRALLALNTPRARLRRISTVPGLVLLVLREVVRSNDAVAKIILSPPSRKAWSAGFVRVPLDMRNPYGLAVLACILTATPGTVLVDYNRSDGTMLLHVLDLIDDEAWIRIVKGTWERRLMEIFE